MLASGAIVAACLWTWLPATATWFTTDDLVGLARAAGLEPSQPLFRPLSAGLAMRLEFAAFGLDPLPWHLVQLMLHAGVSLGVYAIGLGLGLPAVPAAIAGVGFATSGIAFTPLHAVSGIGELLAGAILVAATLLQLRGLSADRAAASWSGAVLAVAAVLAKENAIGWPIAALAMAWGAPRRHLLPPLVAAVAGGTWLLALARVPGSGPGGAYAIDLSPGHLAAHLATYLAWSAGVGSPIRDLVAAPDPRAWGPGLAVTGALAWLVVRARAHGARPAVAGAVWWLALVAPVLPLAHHSYLYYLYLPAIGGWLAVSWSVWAALRGGPRASTILAALALVVVALEVRGIHVRRQATIDALPADRTLRESALLDHAVAGLRAAALPPGTAVGFVNPLPREAVQVPARDPNLATTTRTRYVPLEQALGGGRALALFTPGLVDSGFATTIPAGWDDVEVFLYEQRGWLLRWGRGSRALLEQASLQATAGAWAAAETSFARARADGDSAAEALVGRIVALRQLGRGAEAVALTDTLAQQSPADVRLARLREPGPLDPFATGLVRRFEPRLPVAR